MKKLLFYFLLVMTFSLQAQTETDDKKEILAIMKAQEKAWSEHNLEGFMQGYWKNDSLKFFGSRGITYGWKQTLANYKKGYPTAADSGTLSFTIEDMTAVSSNAYYVMGRYHLKRDKGDAEGIFMIIFKKIDGVWKIVADMSC